MGDFTVENSKLGKEICILTQNQFGRSKIWCAEDTCVTYVQKDFLLKVLLSRYWQNIKFSQNCPKFHIIVNHKII